MILTKLRNVREEKGLAIKEVSKKSNILAKPCIILEQGKKG